MSPEVIIMKKEDKELNKIFSANIKYLISRSGKRQQDVAAELGVPRTTFNNWCVGKVLPSLPKLRALAEYFHVEEDALVRPLVGSAIMFSMQLTSEELDLVEAFRAAAPAERSRAMAILKEPAVSIVPRQEDLDKLIAQSEATNEELVKSISETIERINSKRIRPLTPAQQIKLAVETVRSRKKEGAE